MARKQTRAQIILSEARARVDNAQLSVDTAVTQVDIYRAALMAHQHAYDALERSLAPKPRKAKASAKQKSLPEAN